MASIAEDVLGIFVIAIFIAIFASRIVETIHTAFCVQILYQYLVTGHNQAEEIASIAWQVAQAHPTPHSPAHDRLSLLSSCKGDAWYILTLLRAETPINRFFIRRIWVLSHGSLVMTAIPVRPSVASQLQYAKSLAPTRLHFGWTLGQWNRFREDTKSKTTFLSSLAMAAMVDLVISLIQIYYLWTSRTGFRRLISVMILVLFEIPALKNNIMFVGLVGIQSKLYANSFLATLNARVHIKKRAFGSNGMDIDTVELNQRGRGGPHEEHRPSKAHFWPDDATGSLRQECNPGASLSSSRSPSTLLFPAYVRAAKQRYGPTMLDSLAMYALLVLCARDPSAQQTSERKAIPVMGLTMGIIARANNRLFICFPSMNCACTRGAVDCTNTDTSCLSRADMLSGCNVDGLHLELGIMIRVDLHPDVQIVTHTEPEPPSIKHTPPCSIIMQQAHIKGLKLIKIYTFPFLQVANIYISNIIGNVMEMLLYLIGGVIAAIRIYAINGHKWALPMAIICLYAPLIGISLYAAVVATYFLQPFGCNMSYDYSIVVSPGFSDLLVLLETWYATYRIHDTVPHAATNVTISTLLRRNCSIHSWYQTCCLSNITVDL
ncbi:predicted protein [Postia placenta Mad-698-R]|nr:predicted protein [Postia placenta Mad-698-R]